MTLNELKTNFHQNDIRLVLYGLYAEKNANHQGYWEYMRRMAFGIYTIQMIEEDSLFLIRAMKII